MGLIQILEDKLIQLLQPIFAPFRPIVQIFTHLKENTFGIFDASTTLMHSIENVINEVRHFQVQPQFKNRLISFPHAVENVQELFSIPGQITAAVRDLILQLKQKVNPASFNVDELDGIEDLRGLFGRLGTKLAAGFEKVLGFITLIVDALVTIRSTIADVQAIIDALEQIVTDISGLDALFLPQGNSRRTLKLADGGSIRIRVGNLHQ